MSFIRIWLFFNMAFGLCNAFASVYNISRIEALETLSQVRSVLTENKTNSPEENDAKLDLLNQIILETDIHFQDGDYRKFLNSTMTQLIDINSKSENRLGIDLRDYLLRLQNSIQEDMEPSENPTLFLARFINVNSILDTVEKPSNMDMEHAYSNGKEWAYVHGYSLEEAGHLAANVVEVTQIESVNKHSDQLDGATQLILSNSISTRIPDSSNASPGIVQLDESVSPYDWILQNSTSPY